MSSVLTKQSVYGAQFSAILDRLPGHGLVWVDRCRGLKVARATETSGRDVLGEPRVGRSRESSLQRGSLSRSRLTRVYF